MTQTFCRFNWTATVVAMVAVGLSALSPSVSQVLPTPSAKPREYSVRWVSGLAEDRTATVRVSGLSLVTLKALQSPRWSLGDWKRVLAVYAESRDLPLSPDHPPMLGRYRIHSGLLSFEPQFPLEPGVAYRAEFHPDHCRGPRVRTGHPSLLCSSFRQSVTGRARVERSSHRRADAWWQASRHPDLVALPGSFGLDECDP